MKVVGRQLSKASARLEKARNNENKCFRRASLLDPSDPKRKKAMDTLAAARGEVRPRGCGGSHCRVTLLLTLACLALAAFPVTG